MAAGEGIARVARREFQRTILPEVETVLRTAAYQIPVTSLSQTEAIVVWGEITLPAGETWVDIGTGDGVTLGRLARKHSGRFIGIDKENSMPLLMEEVNGWPNLSALPENVRYLILSHNRPGRCQIRHDRVEQVVMPPCRPNQPVSDQAREATVNAVGAGTAQVVSLIFPYTETPQQSRLERLIGGPLAQTLHYQLRTAIELLAPGGIGVAILESSESAVRKKVLERTLRFLRAQPEVASIGFTAQGIAAEQLGVAAYAPKNQQGRAVDTEPLTEGRVVFFRRRFV